MVATTEYVNWRLVLKMAVGVEFVVFFITILPEVLLFLFYVLPLIVKWNKVFSN